MPRLVFSERFADDLAHITSAKVEASIMTALDSIEAFADFGSRNIPDSIREKFGDGVRKVVVSPFDLVYTIVGDEVHVETLIHQRAAR